jgi:subtilisin
MNIRILSERAPNPGLDCVVHELGRGTGGEVVEIGQYGCEGGYYRVNDAEQTKLLKIVPLDGHWSLVEAISGGNQTIHCPPIEDDLANPWWQRVVGADDRSEGAAAGIRIGVVDLAFKPTEALEHVEFVTKPADLLAVLNRVSEPETSHGQRVCSVIAARGPDGFKGIAEGAEVFFADATFYSSDGRFFEKIIDYPRVATAIEYFADGAKVDLINLSLGFEQDLEDLSDSIEEAADNGILCVCAGGNSFGPPEFPARLDSVVGVGGVGFDHIAPAGTAMAKAAEFSEQRTGLGGNFPGFGHIFHDPDTCHGQGVDVCAPSLGIIMLQRNGAIVEYRGTSYAAPIVVGVLARRLAADAAYGCLSGRPRYEHARNKLAEMCVEIDINGRKLGRGMPRL